MLTALIICLFFALITGLASALHGSDGLPKFLVIIQHLFSAYLVNPILIIAVAIFWIFLRRAKQARAELDYLRGWVSIKAIVKAYPLFLGHLVAIGISDVKTRRYQEIISGFIIGFVLSIILMFVSFLIGYL